MIRVSLLISCLFSGITSFPQKWSAKAYALIEGGFEKGKWQYDPVQRINSVIDFVPEKISIKDSSGAVNYRLMKDVVTKRIEEDSCITSLRTGYDKNNIRCMVNILEFNNGTNILNVVYANLSYSYYFRYLE